MKDSLSMNSVMIFSKELIRIWRPAWRMEYNQKSLIAEN